jgi:HK97 family phage major capsid protein
MKQRHSAATEFDQAECILARAESEQRDLTEVEVADYNATIERAERAAKLEYAQGLIAKGQSENGFNNGRNGVHTTNHRDPWARERNESHTGLVTRANDAVERADITDTGREMLTRALENSGSSDAAEFILNATSPAYESAFASILRDPVRGHLLWSDQERDAYRNVEHSRAALSLTDGNGGYLVPFTLDPTVNVTNAGNRNSFRNIARIETTLTNTWNGAASAGITPQWLGEGVEAADASPTFTRITLTPAKLAAYVYASYEVMADSNIASQLPTLIADAFSTAEGEAFATGSGSGAPKGIVTALTAVTASRVSATTGGSFGIQDVYAVDNALPARSRNGRPAWVASRAILNKIRQFDTYGGSSFWSDLTGDAPAQLLGSPVYESSAMVATTTTGSNVLVLADFSQFVIVDRIGTVISYDPMLQGSNGRATGQAGWFAYKRTSSDLLNTDAGRILKL